jgi:hypothetical protein
MQYRFITTGLLLALCGLTYAQIPVPKVDPGAGTTVARGTTLLGSEYRDEQAGYRMAPPVDAQVVTKQVTTNLLPAGQKSSHELLTFLEPRQQYSGGVALVVMAKSSTVEEIVTQISADLTASVRGIQILEAKAVAGVERPQARLVATMEMAGATPEAKGVPYINFNYFSQMSETRFMHLSLLAPLANRAAAELTFAAMVKEFEVLDPAVTAEKRRQAIEAGRKWFQQRSADELLKRINSEPRYFRILRNNRDIGYMRHEEQKVKRDGFDGFILSSYGTIFTPEGTMVLMQTRGFWALGDMSRGHYSSWESLVNEYQLVDNERAKRSLAWVLEVGIVSGGKDRTGNPVYRVSVNREQYPTMIQAAAKVLPKGTKDTFGTDQPLTSEELNAGRSFREWQLTMDMPAPLPKPLEILWPRLMDLKQNESMAFAVYNGEEKRMDIRTLSIKGPDRIDLGGQGVDTIRLLDQLDPGQTTSWVDERGNIQMMKTAQQTAFVPTTKERMAQMWGVREAKFKQAQEATTTTVITPGRALEKKPDTPNPTPR